MNSIVSITKVNYPIDDLRAEVITRVTEAMELAGWQNFISPGADVCLKPNLCLDILLPGHITSNWVMEGVVLNLKNYVGKIYVIESDTWTTDVERGVRISGLYRLCEQYGLVWHNLTKNKYLSIPLPNNFVLGDVVEIPEILQHTELITVPVMKTHGNTIISGAVKNQWGCLKKVRLNYHERINEALVDLVRLVKPRFCVMDATVTCEGKGPKQGLPKLSNYIVATADCVAMDKVMAAMIGIPEHQTPRFITLGDHYGLGNGVWDKINVVGEEIKKINLSFCYGQQSLLTTVDLFCRKPVLKFLLYHTIIFRLIIFIAKLNYVFWMFFWGNKRRDEIVYGTPYGQQWREKTLTCPLCKGVAIKYLTDRDVELLTAAYYTVYRCLACQLMFVYPHPTPENLIKLYPREFYGLSIQGQNEQFVLSQGLKLLFNQIEIFFYHERYKLINRVITAGKGIMLDIGCGTGKLLALFRNNGWDVAGVETSFFGVEFCRVKYNLEVFHGTLTSAAFPDERFDLVTMFHVLEHIDDYTTMLTEIKRIIKKSGTLVISVPNSASWEAKVTKNKWAFFDLPRHLYHFSLSTLTKILTQSGFSVFKVSCFSWEYSILISLQTGLNFFCRNKMFLYRLLKQRIDWNTTKDKLGLVLDLMCSIFGGILLLFPVLIYTLLTTFLGNGNNLTIFCRKSGS